MIHLKIVFSDGPSPEAELLCKGWDLKDGNIYIVESDEQHRVVAAGTWTEIISRKPGDVE